MYGVELDPFNGNCDLDDNPVEDPIGNRMVGNIYQHLDLLCRDYYGPDNDLSTGILPDTPEYAPESAYTFSPEPSIGIIDEQSRLSPSDKYPVCSYELKPLLKSPLDTTNDCDT